MALEQDTCWTVIERAAQGSPGAREAFAQHYLPPVTAYLRARWRAQPLIQEADDAVQEVFLECFRSVLARSDRTRVPCFRTYLYGVVRNVARRFEEQRTRRRERQPGGSVFEDALPAREESLSQVYDRAWAVAVLARARDRQVRTAREKGQDALTRIELLRLRLEEGVPIREIARLWGREAAWLHHQYAAAREEFRAALLETVALEHSGTPAEIAYECEHLVSFFA